MCSPRMYRLPAHIGLYHATVNTRMDMDAQCPSMGGRWGSRVVAAFNKAALCCFSGGYVGIMDFPESI
jgi:hypothetical protein